MGHMAALLLERSPGSERTYRELDAWAHTHTHMQTHTHTQTHIHTYSTYSTYILYIHIHIHAQTACIIICRQQVFGESGQSWPPACPSVALVVSGGFHTCDGEFINMLGSDVDKGAAREIVHL